MARPRDSREAQVVNYFRSADFEQAELVFGIVHGIIRERRPVNPGVKVRRARKPRVSGQEPGSEVQ